MNRIRVDELCRHGHWQSGRVRAFDLDRLSSAYLSKDGVVVINRLSQRDCAYPRWSLTGQLLLNCKETRDSKKVCYFGDLELDSMLGRVRRNELTEWPETVA